MLFQREIFLHSLSWPLEAEPNRERQTRSQLTAADVWRQLDVKMETERSGEEPGSQDYPPHSSIWSGEEASAPSPSQNPQSWSRNNDSSHREETDRFSQVETPTDLSDQRGPNTPYGHISGVHMLKIIIYLQKTNTAEKQLRYTHLWAWNLMIESIKMLTISHQHKINIIKSLITVIIVN